MKAKVPRAAHGVICFDEASRIILVSSQAQKFSADLFGCVPRIGEPLPEALRETLGKLSETRPSSPGDTARLEFRKDGSYISLALALDPQGKHHCLLFERKKDFSHPSELTALGLTARETFVAFWILNQKTNWEIGKILHISTRTVDKHVEKIFLKLGVNDRRDLVHRAQEFCDP